MLLTIASCACLQLPSEDEVEFWKSPEKAGWLQSQGEVIKTWRRRWFVLKQGYLFRFMGSDVAPSSKPRGVVDLSKVTDVSDGREATGRPNSLKLSTETGARRSPGARECCAALVLRDGWPRSPRAPVLFFVGT
jgi:PH domain